LESEVENEKADCWQVKSTLQILSNQIQIVSGELDQYKHRGLMITNSLHNTTVMSNTRRQWVESAIRTGQNGEIAERGYGQHIGKYKDKEGLSSKRAR